MTVSKNLEITCNSCYETKTWALSALRSSSIDSILENHGYTSKYHGWSEGKTHWCPDCNNRDPNTYYIYDGYDEEYLGEIEAWSIVDARRVAWNEFNCENMVRQEKK